MVQDLFMSFWRYTRRRHIDSAVLRLHEGFKTFTIPALARCDHLEIKWVLVPVPVKPAIKQRQAAASGI